MAEIEKMLGKTVKNGKGGDVDVSSFTGAGKIVGLYFSAHWCPPCRNFTPVLAEFYKKMKAKEAPFEIVFLSSDRDASSFNDYFAEMPWLALDFANRDVKEKVSAKYGVRGIPTLIILNGETGETITTGGREIVAQNPDTFPWQ